LCWKMVTGTNISLEKLWNDADFIPNDQQKEAILYIDGPLYLPAGPGSGKTKVLLWRTLNLIVFHDVNPDEIFLSTFTEKAAFQLREGLRTLLGAVTTATNMSFDISNMYVGTVHSLCGRLSSDRRFSSERRRRRAPLLLDEIDQYLYLYNRARWNDLTRRVGFNDGANTYINQYFAAHASESRHEAVMNCIALFNRLSEECLDPERAKIDADDDLKMLLALYKEYLKSLKEPHPVGTVDFSLLQQHALLAIKAHQEASKIFKYVIIDEYQDTNPIQERLFFELARGHKNICVVGDDDQALYRFRGATVENFVQFPKRCRRELGISPHEIHLTKNYRSRRKIVSFYNQFASSWDWTKKGDGRGQPTFRIKKTIEATRKDGGPSVIASTPGRPEDVCREIAGLVSQLLDKGIVDDANRIAFLFPSLKSRAVKTMIAALEEEGLKVYAPRAGRFLEVLEAIDMFGIFVQIIGRPTRGAFPGRDYRDFHDWLNYIDARGKELVKNEQKLKQYVFDRKKEIENAINDYHLLLDFIAAKKWDLKSEYKIETMKRPLANVPGLSIRARRSLSSSYFDRIVRQRAQDHQQGLSDRLPFTLNYIIRRATAMDWSLLDLFYRICGFEHFRAMFDLAEFGHDEGPVTNLGLISQYLERFIEQYTPMITADILTDDHLNRLFFGSYLFALFRRGESEYEDVEDPFPKGRVPFITIHQAKGLEFPVVVLGNATWRAHDVRRIEQIVRPLTHRDGEPLERMDGFDTIRMFYVALSRARDLLVIADYRGQGYSRKEPFASMLDGALPRIPNFEVTSVPKSDVQDIDLPRNYSYTSDYLFYLKCPRQYMIFRKYGFVESRSTTMFFGSLVHQTLADLHEHLISKRQTA
jgi:DNA helicase-2/ATP-dependent DNA helicase PcrA